MSKSTVALRECKCNVKCFTPQIRQSTSLCNTVIHCYLVIRSLFTDLWIMYNPINNYYTHAMIFNFVYFISNCMFYALFSACDFRNQLQHRMSRGYINTEPVLIGIGYAICFYKRYMFWQRTIGACFICNKKFLC